MRGKKKKGRDQAEHIQTVSKRSFELDPPLKGFTNTSTTYGDPVNFILTYPTKSEIANFARENGDLTELKEEFKDSINKIATSFREAFPSLKDYNSVNFEIHKILIENFFNTAKALAVSVEARDPYTGGHSERVSQISSELGKRCNLTTTEQMYLQGGALLHDVGKIGIRDGVLLKPGPLTDLEYKEMQHHTIIGAQIVKKMNCLSGCIDVVLLHHERIDGYGYPYGLKGDKIPLIARITSVADAYDAMTSNRIYRKALSHEEAIEEVLRSSGTQFDPEIVKVFVEWWEETFQDKTSKKNKLSKV